MNESPKRNFDERFSELESNQAALATEVKGLRKDLQSVTDWLKQIANKQSERDKPNIMAWLAALSFLGMLFTGYWSINNLRIETAVEPLAKKFEEVETQFNADAQLRNVQFSEQQRLNAVMWNASDLGKVSAYPNAPFYQPNISQQMK